jgi:hypothetical protein
MGYEAGDGDLSWNLGLAAIDFLTGLRALDCFLRLSLGLELYRMFVCAFT